jgi:hypothetical protein
VNNYEPSRKASLLSNFYKGKVFYCLFNSFKEIVLEIFSGFFEAVFEG